MLEKSSNYIHEYLGEEPLARAMRLNPGLTEQNLANCWYPHGDWWTAGSTQSHNAQDLSESFSGPEVFRKMNHKFSLTTQPDSYVYTQSAVLKSASL